MEKHREKVNPVSGHIAEQSRVKPRKREAPTDDFQTEVCLSGLFVFLQKKTGESKRTPNAAYRRAVRTQIRHNRQSGVRTRRVAQNDLLRHRGTLSVLSDFHGEGYGRRRVGARRIPPRKKVSHRKAKGIARKAVRGIDIEGRRNHGVDTFAIHAGGRKKDGGQMKLEKVREDLQ